MRLQRSEEDPGGSRRVEIDGDPRLIAAVETARRWRFRPAVRDDRPVPAVAYLVFGFRAPVVVPRPEG